MATRSGQFGRNVGNYGRIGIDYENAKSEENQYDQRRKN